MFQNTVNFVQGKQNGGLVYDNATIKDLVNKDTDGDGILDWEEPLYGLDPTQKETTPGTPDNSVIAKLRTEKEYDTALGNSSIQNPENLTQTDKFSRELFSTVASLNQNGTVSQDTVNQIGGSLADKIKNRAPRKIYVLSDIKIVKNDLFATIKNYADTLNNIFKNYPANSSVMDVLQKFIIDDNNVDTSVLTELDPIIKQTQNAIDAMTKMNVPESLAPLHLDFLNGMERVVENLNDIKLYDSDSIVALSGIQQYETNTTLLESSVKNLSDIVSQKLKN